MPTVTVSGLPMTYELRGSGDPLVLVAGTGYPGATWHPALVDRLAERHRVLTFDHRGTGATPVGSEAFSTRLFASDAAGLLGALDLPPAHVVGHSMGGRVAQWMALDHRPRVRTLVLAATGPGAFRPDRPVVRGIPLRTAVAMIEQGYEGYMRRHIAETFFTPEFVSSSPGRVAWLVDAFWSHRPALEAYLRHVIARQEHQTLERLQEISLPTLVMVGDRDTHEGGTGIHWEQSAALVAGIPGATRAIMEGMAHGYFWQAPERSAEVILGWTAGH